MKKLPAVLRSVFSLAAFVTLGAAQTAAQTAAPAASAHVDASAPIAKQDNGTFVKRHESFLARGKAGPIGLLFLGDSITDAWSKAPHIWKAYYDKYEPANFGIGGDTTQNVIWRIEQGELDGIPAGGGPDARHKQFRQPQRRGNLRRRPEDRGADPRQDPGDQGAAPGDLPARRPQERQWLD